MLLGIDVVLHGSNPAAAAKLQRRKLVFGLQGLNYYAELH